MSPVERRRARESVEAFLKRAGVKRAGGVLMARRVLSLEYCDAGDARRVSLRCSGRAQIAALKDGSLLLFRPTGAPVLAGIGPQLISRRAYTTTYVHAEDGRRYWHPWKGTPVWMRALPDGSIRMYAWGGGRIWKDL